VARLRLPMTKGDYHLSFPRLMAFALPQWPLAAIGLPVAVFLPPFYAGELGLGVQAVGLVFLFARFWDVITDPIMGIVSDRYPSRWGRRRHWIMIGTPILMIAAFVIFNPTLFYENASAGMLLFWMILMYVGWTMVTLNHLSWTAEVHTAYHERSRIQAAVQALTIVGMIVVLLIPVLVGGRESALVDQMSAIGWYIFLALLPAVAIAVFLVPEHEPDPQDAENAAGFKQILEILKNNDPLRRLLAVFILDGLLTGLVSSLFRFYTVDALKLGQGANILLLIYFLVGVIMTPLWAKLSYKVGKRKALVTSMLYSVLSLGLLFVLPSGNLLIAILFFTIIGGNFGATTFLARSVMSDVTEYDTYLSGKKRTGLFFALMTLTIKAGVALAIGIAYSLLLPMIGYEAGAENSESAISGLRIIYALVPMVCALAMAAIMWTFPLDESRQDEIRAALQNDKEG
jgi:glycoside/pentoside/hexuronide:cation symporter, GPH family